MITKLPKDAPVSYQDDFGDDDCEHGRRVDYKKKKKAKRLERELKRRQARLDEFT